MNEEDYQTPGTDPYEPGVSSEEGDGNVASESEDSPSQPSAPEGLTLDAINELLGRKGENAYKSLEDAKKGLSNLNSFVGKKVEAKPPTTSEDKYGYMAQKIFTLETPDAKELLDVVVPYAKANKLTLDEAWTTKFADTFTKSEAPKDTTVIKPTRQVRSATPNEMQTKIENMSLSELKDNYSSLAQSMEQQ